MHRRVLTSVFLLSLLGSGCASTRPPAAADAGPKSPGAALLHEAIGVLSTKPSGRGRVDWADVERRLRPEAVGSVDRAYPAIVLAVGELHDAHARFVRAAPALGAGAPPTDSAAHEGAAPAKSLPVIPTLPVVTRLGSTAYLLVPGCGAPDIAGLRAYATALRQEILKHGACDQWVIDLRLNGGGNVWPMLLGAQPLLGSGVMMTSIEEGTPPATYGVDPGGAWIDWGRGPETQLGWGDASPAPARVRVRRIAVLMGPWTMSSGEALAICLRGLPGARTFGEPTAGLTTVTNLFPLSDGSVLNLPTSHMGDRHGVAARGALTPEVRTPQGDWPSVDDHAAREAFRWVEGRDEAGAS